MRRRTDRGKVDADARAYVEAGKKSDGAASTNGIFRHFFFITQSLRLASKVKGGDGQV